MKKTLLYFSVILTLISTTSCMKDYTCECNITATAGSSSATATETEVIEASRKADAETECLEGNETQNDPSNQTSTTVTCHLK